MNRRILTSPALVAVAALTGCQNTPQRDVGFEDRGTLRARTAGVQLQDDGVRGIGGMFGNVCDFKTDPGAIHADYDLAADGDEEVQDAVDTDSVVVTGSTIFTVDNHAGLTSHGMQVPGVDQVRFAGDGLVAVRELSGCSVAWFDAQGANQDPNAGDSLDSVTGTPRTSVDIDDDWCSGGGAVSSSQDSGVVWLGGADGVLRVDEHDGAQDLDAAGELVHWDPVSGALYVAAWGGTEVMALEADGALRWQTAVDGRVTALGDLGAIGGAAVVVERGTVSDVVALDGTTGQDMGHIDAVDAPVTAVDTSADGTVIALSRATEVRFYNVELD